MRGQARTPLALLLWALVSLLAGCEGLDCGPGTHQEGDQCVPNLAINCDGDGVEFRDGRCVPQASVCGQGTTWDAEARLCVAQGGTSQDLGQPEDMQSQDLGDDQGTLDMAEADMVAEDMGGEDMPTGPACQEPAAGTLCLSGRVLDWSTGAPVQAQEPLAILVDDLLLRSAQPNKAPFGAALLEEGGAFVLADVPLQDDLGPLQQMILIAGAAQEEGASAWQRTLTGVLSAPGDGARLDGTPAFVVPAELVQRWGELLGDQIQGTLGLEQGLLLLRVVDAGGGAPVEGATVRFTDPEVDGRYTRLYLSNDLRSFLDRESTGASGAVLVVGPPGVGNLTASAQGLEFAPIPAGVNPGVAVAAALLGFAP